VPIEAIKEIRTGADARYYREQFQLASSYEDRWLTLVYIVDGGYKTLHVICATRAEFALWEDVLRKLHALRQALMRGLGNADVREDVWARQYWAGGSGGGPGSGAREGEGSADEKLDFEEVVRMCRRLNINSPREELLRLYKVRVTYPALRCGLTAWAWQQADVDSQGYLDFAAFRHFVKLLKSRRELTLLYHRLRRTGANGVLDFTVFTDFMRGTQKVRNPPRRIHFF
jgi:phosphatidylinositol phospholipase C delta